MSSHPSGANGVPRLRELVVNYNRLPLRGFPNRHARRASMRSIREDARLVRVASSDAYRRHGFRGFYTEHAALYAVEQAARRLWRKGTFNMRERLRVRELMRAQRAALAATPTLAGGSKMVKAAMVVGVAAAVGLVLLVLGMLLEGLR